MVIALASGAFAACSSASNGGAAGFDAIGGGGSDAGSGFGGASSGASGNFSGSSGGGSSGGSAPPTPEVKVENSFQSPVATGEIVWIADPTSGVVAYIDAKTLAVGTVNAGNGPTYLAAVPDPVHMDDVAIVQNALSHDATLLRWHGGTVTTVPPYPSTDDANSWAISPKGRWAIAWTDSTFEQNLDPAQGFQHIEVIDITGQRPPIQLNVGYRPSQVVFSGDETHAYAVTQVGLSVLDLTGGTTPAAVALYDLSAPTSPAPVPESGAPEASVPDSGPDVAVDDAAPDGAPSDGPVADGPPGDGPLADAAPLEASPAPSDAGGGSELDAVIAMGDGGAATVTSTPDVSFSVGAQYALVRLDTSKVVTVVSMTDGTAVPVTLPSYPTDLTVSPTGTFAIAAMREQASSSIAILPLPDIFTNPAGFTTVSIPGQTVGRAIVTNDGKTAILFTTVEAVNSLTVLSLGSAVGDAGQDAGPPSYRNVALQEPVLAVFPTPDGKNAVVLHQPPTSSSSGTPAFSLVPVNLTLPALIQSVTAPPTAVAVSPGSEFALVSTRNDQTKDFGVYLGLFPSLQIVPYKLASAPTAVGVAQVATKGYVAQDYPEGRITLIDPLAASSCDASSCTSSRTITGFELSARVVNGGMP